MSSLKAAPERGKLLLAFFLLYVIWGSTYLAIRYAIATLPPFLMAGLRFTLAGALMYGWLRLRGVASPPWSQWWRLGVIGVFLFLGGNGFVVWAEQYISSGLAALLVATLPLWLILLDWLWADGARPGALALAGLAFGLIGTFILVDPMRVTASDVYLPGAGMVVLASLLWAFGSIYSKKIERPKSIFMLAACQMIGGGVVILLVAALLGEFQQLHLGEVSLLSAVSFFYLVIFGSMVAISAYFWLLQNASASSVSTYAFVNPAVAVLLGWLIAGEALNARILTGAGIILAGVILVLRESARRGAKA
ncbi:MAG: EamA family transporter [Pseudomonadales bacterium]|jgi:drug/metabolite transporter (DMT)-like permease|nr:EamA family transporter [Pseudomonadales bacterium]